MARIVEFLKREVTEVAAVTAYFLVAFVTIGVLVKLFLVQFDVEFAGIVKAVIGALVVAKVVVVLDKTQAGERFRNHPVWMTVLYRSLVYTIVVAGVLALENVFHGYRATGSLPGGIEHALHTAEVSRGAAVGICIFLSFIVYGLFNEMKRAVGFERMMRFLLDPDGRTVA